VSYKILYHKNFLKDFKKVPFRHQENIKEILRQILKNPATITPNTKPLADKKHVFRTRIGNLRLVYYISHKDKLIKVLGINTRGNIYKIIGKLLN